MKKQLNQSGRSMVEMLGVLAIIGVLSVGGIAGYSKAMEKYRTQKALDQLTLLINNLRSLPGQYGFDGYGNQTELAIRLGIFPTEMLNGKTSATATKAYGVFNSEVEIGMSDYEISITYPIGRSVYACTTLATADWGDGLYEIGIGGAGDVFFREDFPIKLPLAAKECKDQIVGDYDGYIFISYKK
ncbi:MAG: hypothetical protein J6K16_01160 [Alphaproteobacteria bacterium]|nr:hypothetical protein [Alphaproteobacteria bacterium]